MGLQMISNREVNGFWIIFATKKTKFIHQSVKQKTATLPSEFPVLKKQHNALLDFETHAFSYHQRDKGFTIFF